MENYKYKLRAHHGMCLAFFKGHGYSREFCSNMQKILDSSKNNPYILLTDSADSICEKCPNLQNSICETQEKVLKYDNEVLKRLNIKSGTVMKYKDFESAVKNRILITGEREKICGDCEWNRFCK